MEMIKMKYKDFEFDVNPTDIRLSMSKNISKHSLPYKAQSCEEMGKNAAVVSGKGYFLGEDAMNKAYALSRVYNKKGSDYLFTPYCVPIKVFFSSLDIIYSASNSRVEYTFEFTQDKPEKKDTYDFGYTIAKDGENLFDIANRTGLEIEKIASLNDFGDLFSVKEGDRVWLI